MTVILSAFRATRRVAYGGSIAYNGSRAIQDRATGRLGGRSTDAYQELRDRLGDLAVEGISRTRDMVDEVAFGGAGGSGADRPYDHRGDPTLN